jgi:hypothetical protein
MNDVDRARLIKLLTVIHVRAIEVRDFVRANSERDAAEGWEALKHDIRSAETLFRAYGLGFGIIEDLSLLELGMWK